VDIDLLVLFEPGVKGAPLESHGIPKSRVRVGAIDPGCGRTMNAIDLECVSSRCASAQLLRVLLVDQHLLINVGERDVVLGVLFPLPDVKR
jgi:hypothetical protein